MRAAVSAGAGQTAPADSNTQKNTNPNASSAAPRNYYGVLTEDVPAVPAHADAVPARIGSVDPVAYRAYRAAPARQPASGPAPATTVAAMMRSHDSYIKPPSTSPARVVHADRKRPVAPVVRKGTMILAMAATLLTAPGPSLANSTDPVGDTLRTWHAGRADKTFNSPPPYLAFTPLCEGLGLPAAVQIAPQAGGAALPTLQQSVRATPLGHLWLCRAEMLTHWRATDDDRLAPAQRACLHAAVVLEHGAVDAGGDGDRDAKVLDDLDRAIAAKLKAVHGIGGKCQKYRSRLHKKKPRVAPTADAPSNALATPSAATATRPGEPHRSPLRPLSPRFEVRRTAAQAPAAHLVDDTQDGHFPRCLTTSRKEQKDVKRCVCTCAPASARVCV